MTLASTDDWTQDNSTEVTSDDWQLVKNIFKECLGDFLNDKDWEQSELYCFALDIDFGRGEFNEVTLEDVEQAFIDIFEYNADGYGLENDDCLIDLIIESKEANIPSEEKVKSIIWQWLEDNYEDAKIKALEEYDEYKLEQEYYKYLNELEWRRIMPYKDFLKTDYWQKQVRPIIIERDKRCRTCGSTENLEVHHISYEHRGDDINHLENLTLLCRGCHQIIHNYYIWSYKNFNI
jgi:hypothetical protein